MLNFYKNQDGKISVLENYETGCWVNTINPTKDEINFLHNNIGIDMDFIKASLDDEETPRIDIEDEQTLIILDIPIAEELNRKNNPSTIQYYTLPMGIVLTKDNIITISTGENPIIAEIIKGIIKSANPHLKTRFLLLILLRTAIRFLQHIRQIQKITSLTENQLHKMMKNKEIIQLLELQKSLVYFSSSLKSNEVTVQKLLRGRIIKLYDEDQDLLEDVIVEFRQAIDMCSINTGILTNTMDAFASIISNNLNIAMKILTSLTILMAIPTMISGFYGMNVSNIPLGNFWVVLGISTFVTMIVAAMLLAKGMFR